ncbi:hypothetical protein TNCV_1423801 [Trichonephila clavipes]|nr:hypothetical protein TNCV_1423801 [Trichonephila clavipes]
MVSLGHPSLPPTDFGRLDDEEASPGMGTLGISRDPFTCHRTDNRRPERKQHFLLAGTPSVIRGVRVDLPQPNRVEGESTLKHWEEQLCLPLPSLITYSVVLT